MAVVQLTVQQRIMPTFKNYPWERGRTIRREQHTAFAPSNVLKGTGILKGKIA